MPKSKIFKPNQFIPTEFSTAEDKAKFANQFVDFVESNYSRRKFPMWFYRQLSNCFMFIAYYDQDGFYSEFFTSYKDVLRFLSQCLNFRCYGSPTHTYSDVEKALQVWLRENNIFQIWHTHYREYKDKYQM